MFSLRKADPDLVKSTKSSPVQLRKLVGENKIFESDETKIGWDVFDTTMPKDTKSEEEEYSHRPTSNAKVNDEAKTDNELGIPVPDMLSTKKENDEMFSTDGRRKDSIANWIDQSLQQDLIGVHAVEGDDGVNETRIASHNEILPPIEGSSKYIFNDIFHRFRNSLGSNSLKPLQSPAVQPQANDYPKHDELLRVERKSEEGNSDPSSIYGISTSHPSSQREKNKEDSISTLQSTDCGSNGVGLFHHTHSNAVTSHRTLCSPVSENVITTRPLEASTEPRVIKTSGALMCTTLQQDTSRRSKSLAVPLSTNDWFPDKPTDLTNTVSPSQRKVSDNAGVSTKNPKGSNHCEAFTQRSEKAMPEYPILTVQKDPGTQMNNFDPIDTQKSHLTSTSPSSAKIPQSPISSSDLGLETNHSSENSLTRKLSRILAKFRSKTALSCRPNSGKVIEVRSFTDSALQVENLTYVPNGKTAVPSTVRSSEAITQGESHTPSIASKSDKNAMENCGSILKNEDSVSMSQDLRSLSISPDDYWKKIMNYRTPTLSLCMDILERQPSTDVSGKDFIGDVENKVDSPADIPPLSISRLDTTANQPRSEVVSGKDSVGETDDKISLPGGRLSLSDLESAPGKNHLEETEDKHDLTHLDITKNQLTSEVVLEPEALGKLHEEPQKKCLSQNSIMKDASAVHQPKEVVIEIPASSPSSGTALEADHASISTLSFTKDEKPKKTCCSWCWYYDKEIPWFMCSGKGLGWKLLFGTILLIIGPFVWFFYLFKLNERFTSTCGECWRCDRSEYWFSCKGKGCGWLLLLIPLYIILGPLILVFTMLTVFLLACCGENVKKKTTRETKNSFRTQTHRGAHSFRHQHISSPSTMRAQNRDRLAKTT